MITGTFATPFLTGFLILFSAMFTAPVLSSLQAEGTELTFAAGRDDEFVHHYVITVEKDKQVVLTRKILADFYRHPQPSLMKGSYSVSLGDLPAGRYSVSLVAVDSWDAASKPLETSLNIQ